MNASLFQIGARLVAPIILISVAKAGLDALVRTVKKEDLDRADLLVNRALRRFSWRSYVEALTFGGVSADIGVFVRLAREGNTSWITQYRELPLYIIAIHIAIYTACLYTHKVQDVSLISVNQRLSATLNEDLETHNREVEKANLAYMQAKYEDQSPNTIRQLQKNLERAQHKVKDESSRIKDLSGLKDLKKRFHALSWIFPPISWLLALVVLGGQ